MVRVLPGREVVVIVVIATKFLRNLSETANCYGDCTVAVIC